MSDFGQMLRQQRESSGATLEDVSAAIKVPPRHLRSLEQNDFSALPGEVFNKGFVRAYAEFIGADPETLVHAYLSEAQAQSGAVADSSEILKQLATLVDAQVDTGATTEAARRWLLPVAGAILALLLLGGWLFLPRPSQPTPEPAIGKLEPLPSPVRTFDPAPVPTAAKPTLPESVSTPRAVVEPSTVPDALVAATATLEVEEHGVGSRIVDRELVGRGDRFLEGSSVSFWTRVVGGEPGEKIRHVWIDASGASTAVSLTLGGPHWRTHSTKTLFAGSSGRWTVEARDSEERVLASSSFDCFPD